MTPMVKTWLSLILVVLALFEFWTAMRCFGKKDRYSFFPKNLKHVLVFRCKPGDRRHFTAQAGRGVGRIIEPATVGVHGAGYSHDRILGVVAEGCNVVAFVFAENILTAR